MFLVFSKEKILTYLVSILTVTLLFCAVANFQTNIGETIEIKLFKPINKKKEIIGVLKQFDENTIVVLTNDEQIAISRRDISQIKKVYEW